MTTPVVAFRPVAPDADWEQVRARLMSTLVMTAPTTWTDHNAVEPGVTLAEAAAFGLADLHYRTASRTLAGWPLEVGAWRPPAERHWHATLPVGGTAGLADVLAGPSPTGTGTVAAALEPLVRAAGSPGDALALLAGAPWAGLLDAGRAPVAIALLRGRLVRQVAHEHTDRVAAAVDAQRTGGTVAERDARAVAELAPWLGLWTEEVTAVVRRERRRRTTDALVARLDAVAAASTPTAVAAVRAELLARDLSAAEAELALASARVPPDLLPEDLEEADGASRVWPPHRVQALTCEPVTEADYARRARAHPQVGRAWAVPGRLPGVAWDGRAVTAATQRPGTVTLVVERTAGAGGTEAFLREVLAVAIGSEVREPHPSWRDTLDPLDPRRMLGDEVGAAVLADCEVVLQGALVTGLGADRAATVATALERVAAYLAAGRASRRPAQAPEPAVGGPWPRVDQPTGGWTPGEPIHFAEVVRALLADPTVLGVEGLAIRVGDGPFVPSADGSVPLGPACAPRLRDEQCLRVRFALTAGCADG